ncbi:hypothetical protein KAR28_04830 [Candidatus Parcubacteria bacterium]|nr:hypothetical protein [Candidatus Parcubacteria bacterium]
MSIETTISIIGFGLSVGAFFPLLLLKDRRREVAVIALATIICVVTAWHALRWYNYDKELSYVRSTILAELAQRDLTYDDMRQKLGDIDAMLISEAIHDMLRKNEIIANVVELHSVNGQPFDVRLYQVARIGNQNREPNK